VAAALPPDAAPAKSAAAPPPPAKPDAGAPAVAVASSAPAPAPTQLVAPPSSDGKLLVATTPAGAVVYLDGAAKGHTPLDLPATGDKHKLAIVLEGYKLHRVEVNGGAHLDVKLEPVEKRKGPAGIKVVCSSSKRHYIIIDGEHTGLFCPNQDRINVELGEHTVEVYDLVTDATQTQKVNVVETHNSLRVKISD
jgi:hypothetical protein